MIQPKTLVTVVAAVALSTILNVKSASAQFPMSGNQSNDSDTTTLGQMAGALNPMNWKMPKLKMPNFKAMLPTKQEKDMVVKKKDSLFSEVSNTAKRGWTRTKETLNPMRMLPAGFKSNTRSEPQPKSNEGGGFFSSLFSPSKPEPKTEATVTSFLRQEKVR